MQTIETTEQRSIELSRQGAIMTVWKSPPESYLVGQLRWLSDSRLFFFAANGDSPADAHEVEFDSTLMESSAVRFFHAGKLVGLLTPLERAEVPDAEDYHVGWQVWQISAPMKQPLIDQLVEASQRD